MRKGVGTGLLLLTLALIVYGSFYPFNVDLARLADANWSRMFRATVLTQASYADVIGNLLIYVPLGLATMPLWNGRYGRAFAAFLTLSLGACLSTSIEFLQQATTDRDSSALDIALNVTSTALGIGMSNAASRGTVHFRAWLRDQRVSAVSLLLLTFWIGSHTVPLSPSVGFYKLQMQIDSLLNSRLSIGGTAEWIAAYTILFMTLRALTKRSKFWAAALVVAAFSLLARLAFRNQRLAFDECLGMTLAFLLVAATRKRRHSSAMRPLFFLVCVAILAYGLSPFDFHERAQAFVWRPFAGFLQAGDEAGYVSLLTKLFLYTGAVWMGVSGGLSTTITAVLVAFMCVMSEWAQQYLPGRLPEITDAILVLIGAAINAVSAEPLRPPRVNRAGTRSGG